MQNARSRRGKQGRQESPSARRRPLSSPVKRRWLHGTEFPTSTQPGRKGYCRYDQRAAPRCSISLPPRSDDCAAGRLIMAAPFTMIPLAALLAPNLTFRTLKVYGAICSFRKDSSDFCIEAGREEIASRCGLNASIVSTATTELQRLGWLIKQGIPVAIRQSVTGANELRWLLTFSRCYRCSSAASVGWFLYRSAGSRNGCRQQHPLRPSLAAQDRRFVGRLRLACIRRPGCNCAMAPGSAAKRQKAAWASP